MKLKTIKDIAHLKGVKVLVRCDFNVPVFNGQVEDMFRMKLAVPTISFLADKGAKLILVSHLESNKGENLSLKPVHEDLERLISKSITFVKDMKQAYEVSESLENGQIALLENVRLFPGEKANDPKFAAELASLADIYVNEAFPVSHRAHASIVGLPKIMPSYAGLRMAEEVTNLSRAFDPQHPFLFILNGAKFSTKLPVLEKFLPLADTIFVGGALANDFFKIRGYEVGQSLVSEGNFDLSQVAKNPKIKTPVDVLTAERQVFPPDRLPADKKIVDAGPETVAMLGELIKAAKFILWNGPLGMYENGYTETTLEMARMIAEATSRRGAISIVGGGDTIAAIEALHSNDKFTFISSGGGAMLDFLAQGSLPGVEALEKSKH